MKKLFIAIWFIIAILLIPLIYDAVDNVMGENIRIDFELIYDDEITYTTTGMFDNFIQYIELGKTISVNFYIEDTINDITLNLEMSATNFGNYISIGNEDIGYFNINIDDTVDMTGFPVSEGVNMWFELGVSSNGLWSILLSLIPLVFVGGLIVYFVKKNGLSD